MTVHVFDAKFLSIQAQDFIEDQHGWIRCMSSWTFLSIQAQDFIEDRQIRGMLAVLAIPEHSSSGLH